MQFKAQVILDSQPWIRDYMELVCDTTPTTQSIVAFICKVCWKQFDSRRLVYYQLFTDTF
jgi:hypothetical protein